MNEDRAECGCGAESSNAAVASCAGPAQSKPERIGAGWDRPRADAGLPMARRRFKLDRVPLIQQHRGCGDRDCTICRSTGTGSILDQPSREERDAARVARYHRQLKLSGAWTPTMRARVAHAEATPDFLQREYEQSWKRRQTLASAGGVAPSAGGGSKQVGTRTVSAWTPSGGGGGGGSVPWTGVHGSVGTIPSGSSSGHSGTVSSFPDDDPWTDGSGFYITGAMDVGLLGIDALFQTWMTENCIPNASFALLWGDGRLVAYRGYTNQNALVDAAFWSRASDERLEAVRDVELPITTKSDRFRIASVSKPFTATAIAQLIEGYGLTTETTLIEALDGRVSISDPVHPEWVESITIADALCHTTGWNRDAAGDPTLDDFAIASARAGANHRVPITRDEIYEWVSSNVEAPTGRRFGHARSSPGSLYSYSNLAYMLLADVVEAQTGVSFKGWVERMILDVIGTSSTGWGRSAVLDGGEMPCWTVAATKTDGLGVSWFTPYESDEHCGAFVSGSQAVRRRATLAPARSSVAVPGCAFWPYAQPNMELRYGAGGMLSTPLDLLRLGWEFSDSSDPVCINRLSRTFMKENWVPSSLGATWGLGWDHGAWGRTGVTGHGGDYDGTQAALAVIEQTFAGLSQQPALSGAVLSLCINSDGTRPTTTYPDLRAFMRGLLSNGTGIPSMSVSPRSSLMWPLTP